MISLPKQLIVIGDSSVYGWGNNEGRGCCERLRKNCFKNKMVLIIFKIRNYTYRLSSKVLVK